MADSMYRVLPVALRWKSAACANFPYGAEFKNSISDDQRSNANFCRSLSDFKSRDVFKPKTVDGGNMPSPRRIIERRASYSLGVNRTRATFIRVPG